MLHGKEILTAFNDRYTRDYEKLNQLQEQSRIDMEFYLGKQYTLEEQQYLLENNRSMITNNMIRRAVNVVHGEQCLNRLSSIVTNVNDIPEEVEASDQHSSCVQFNMQKRQGYNHISECYLGNLVTAINFSEIYTDYSTDFEDGDITFLRIPYNAVIWDPYFQNFDLSDCNDILRRKYISKETAISLLPERAKDINKLKLSSEPDDKFPYIPYSKNYNGSEMLSYDEMWLRDTRVCHYMVNMQTNDIIEFPTKTTKREAQKVVDEINGIFKKETVKLIQKYKPTVNLYVLINGEPFTEGGDPNDIDDYPFTPFISFHNPEYDDFSYNMQSFVRAARDPQCELNKRVSKIIDMIDSRIYNGHYFKPGKVVDEDDLFTAGNHGNIALKENAVIGQDIAPIQMPDVPQSIFAMKDTFDSYIMKSLNLNDSTFGEQQSGQQSGYLTMLQQSSSMVGIQPLLNNLNRSQQLLTQKIVRFQQKWSDKKIERISGNPVATMFRDKDLSKYDIICSQGALTNHQKQLQFSQMVELRQLGVEEITGSMLLKHAPIQAKTELLKEVEANAQAASQQAQKMEELQMQQLDIQNKLSEAEIVSKLSLSTEREARAKADIGLLIERTSESKQNQSEAVLNQVKAAAEIQGMEQDQLMSALQFVMELQAKAEIDDKEREIVSSNVAESGGNKPVNT